MDDRPERLAALRRPDRAREVAIAVMTTVAGIVLAIGFPTTLRLGIHNTPGTGADEPAALPRRGTGSTRPGGGVEVHTELPIGAAP